jgi:hypothetical protein
MLLPALLSCRSSHPTTRHSMCVCLGVRPTDACMGLVPQPNHGPPTLWFFPRPSLCMLTLPPKHHPPVLLSTLVPKHTHPCPFPPPPPPPHPHPHTHLPQSHAGLCEGVSALAARVQADRELTALIRRKFAIKCTTGGLGSSKQHMAWTGTGLCWGGVCLRSLSDAPAGKGVPGRSRDGALVLLASS